MALFKEIFLFPLNAYSVSCPTRSKNLERTLLLTLLLSQLHCRVWFGLPAATVCANFYKIDWLKFDRWTLIVIYRVICKNNRRHLSAWNIGLMKRWIALSHYHKSRGEVHTSKIYGFLTFIRIMQVFNADISEIISKLFFSQGKHTVNLYILQIKTASKSIGKT